MSIEKQLNNALKKYLIEHHGLDVKKVDYFEDSIEANYGCPTCYSDTIVVEIYYVTNDGYRASYSYDGPFSRLLQMLTD